MVPEVSISKMKWEGLRRFTERSIEKKPRKE